MSVKKRNYNDTFLFSLPGEMKKHHDHITEFILKSDRIINKKADNFASVREDVKRYQKSSVIYSTLLRDDVILCLNDVEMPAAFKVFLAKDQKSKGLKRVFIDVSGIIELKNGSYICKNVQKLITYLFQAITWLLYEFEPEALMNNSNITLYSTDCFVKMFDYILGYFRFYGFADNRAKIDYLAALYFMVTILDKDDDQYTHQVAAKLTGVDQSLTNSYSLYYEKEDLLNIDSFITMLTETFKLKGLTTEVFISRWMNNCGTGTQFAPELFQAFCNMMIASYCGAYIVNQKSIDTQCGTSEIKLCTSILKLGESLLTNKMLREGFEFDESVEFGFDNMIHRNIDLKSVLESRQNIPENAKPSKEDCKSVAKTRERIDQMIRYYTQSKQEDSLGNKLTAFARLAINAMSSTNSNYQSGVLKAIINGSTRRYIKDTNRNKLLNLLRDKIDEVRSQLEKYRDSNKDTKILVSNLRDLTDTKNQL